VIAAWNAQAFLTKALSSAVAQSGVALEVIVVDDASTDDTAQVAQGFDDPRIIYIRRPANGGPAAARNEGFRQARGRWIAVLDADDEMAPDRVAKLVAVGDANRADIVADNVWACDGADRRLHIEEQLDGRLTRLTIEDMFSQAMIFGNGLEYGYLKPIFRRDFIKNHEVLYDETLKIGEDFIFVAECLALGANYIRIASAGYDYTRRPGSISHRLVPGQVEAMAEADRRFLQRFATRLSPDELSAVTEHLASLADAASFTRMIDRLKRRDLRAFGQEAIAHPAALRHFRMPVEARWRSFRGWLSGRNAKV